jgi:hypothetical protein
VSRQLRRQFVWLQIRFCEHMRGLYTLTRLAVFASLAITLSASAYRAEYFIRANGERLAGSEICFFAAHEGHDPQSYYFASSEVRCLPATEVIDLPAGRWHFFGRHASGWISADDRSMSYDGPALPEQLYKAIDVELQPSARVDFGPLIDTLGAGEHFAIYIPNTDVLDRPAAVLPLPLNASLLDVPANKPILPVRVRDGRLVEIGRNLQVPDGESRRVERLGPSPGRVDIVAWIDLDDDGLGAHSERLSPPIVTLTDADGVIQQPLFAMSDGRSVRLSLVVFKDVLPGAAHIVLDGDVWKKASLEMNVAREARFRFGEVPLIATPAAGVAIAWSVPADGQAASTTRKSCNDTGFAASPVTPTIRLLRCPNLQPGVSASGADLRAWQVVDGRKASTADRQGVARFTGLDPGVYLVELRFGGFPVARQTIEASRGTRSEQTLRIDALRVFGTVSHEGHPVEAEIRFATGRTFSDTAGRYEAVVAGAPGTEPVTVIPCTGLGKYVAIPETSIAVNSAYDIVLPENGLRIRTVDTAGRPIEAAEVGVVLVRSMDGFEFSGGDYRTDADGKVTLKALAPRAELRACAVAPAHVWACSDPLRLGENEQRDLTLTLRSSGSTRGKLTGPTLVGGWLSYVSQDGIITESAPVGEDGSFELKTMHAAGEHVVITSANQPLIVLRPPAQMPDQPLDIAVPGGRRRSFRVATVAPTPAHFFTLQVGGLRVPLDSLTAHLARRGLSPSVQDRGPAVVADVLQTGPIEVMLSLEPIRDGVRPDDMFILPQYRSTLRVQALGESDEVVFRP